MTDCGECRYSYNASDGVVKLDSFPRLGLLRWYEGCSSFAVTPESEQRPADPTEFASFVSLLDVLLSVSRDELLRKLHGEKSEETHDSNTQTSSAGK